MATTETPAFAVTFDEPDNVERTKRPWHELYPDAKVAVDGTIDAFVANFGNEKPTKGKDGKDIPFMRKLTNYQLPLERDSDHPNMRAVRLINDRCESRKVNCHAIIKSGNVHMVVGKRVVKKRKPRTPKSEA